MAGGSADQLHRLWRSGTLGAVSDGELLDRFVSGRGEPAEAAFEELVNRHGPMVLRVCRSVLHDAHDAEDAFQAVFLVLANRAGAIRRGTSVASWLFGVAHRVALRGKRRAARKRAIDRLAAERTPEGYLPEADDPDWAILHEEIAALPEGLRAPIVLCGLQGLSYEAASARLGASETTVRGRLARARAKLKRRLARRGVTASSVLLVADSVSRVEAVVPPSLAHSTVQVALGFLAGGEAASLARGVLTSMFLNHLKVATVLIILGAWGGHRLWTAVADEPQQPPRVVQAPATTPKPEAPPPTSYRLTGAVRVEGTGEPVPGGKFTVMLGDSSSSHPERLREVVSGPDGRFEVELPPGQARAWTFKPPVGYWAPGNMKSMETFVLSRSKPAHEKTYTVRRGAVWTFELIGPDRKPTAGRVSSSSPNDFFLSEPDPKGRHRLTLPTEAGKATVVANAGENPSATPTKPILIPLEWAAGFRPDAVRTIEKAENGYRLADESGVLATIGDTTDKLHFGDDVITFGEGGRVEPILDGGKLVIRGVFSESGRRARGDLVGRIVDDAGRPIEGVRIGVAYVDEKQGSSGFPDDKDQQAVTDQEGRFRIRGIPTTAVTGAPTVLSLVMRKKGFAGADSPRIRFHPGPGDAPHELEPIRLEPGVSLSGTVVDRDGNPLEGAWVEPAGGYAMREQFTRTDAAGKFTVSDLPKGMVGISFGYGDLMANDKYLADGSGDNLKIQLRPLRGEAFRGVLQAQKALPEPPAPGKPAPLLEVAGWTDGKSRSLADYRGKVVFLDFWGMWCGPCVNCMDSLERLRKTYEPKGVVFLSIHTPEDDIGRVRRFLDLKKSTMVSAIDANRGANDGSKNGATAERYGVRGYPSLILIDRKGDVAFNSNVGTKEGVERMKALGKQMGLDEKTMTEADFYRLWEAFFSREIDEVLKRPAE
jgi:RNA polymerase sigma factor (sigma-70 family)